MSNMVQKYITVSGKKEDVQQIKATAEPFLYKHNGFVELMVSLGMDERSACSHGWADLQLIGDSDEDSICLYVLTPYGNVAHFMDFLRTKFTALSFECYDESDEINENN